MTHAVLLVLLALLLLLLRAPLRSRFMAEIPAQPTMLSQVQPKKQCYPMHSKQPAPSRGRAFFAALCGGYTELHKVVANSSRALAPNK